MSEESTHLQIGDRVMAPWEQTWLYPGTIRFIDDDLALIRFDDGDRGLVPLDSLAAIEWHDGMRVSAKPDPSLNLYVPAVVKDSEGERVLLRFASGVAGWVDVRLIRVPREVEAEEEAEFE